MAPVTTLDAAVQSTAQSASHFADIPLEVQVELDRKTMTVSQILELEVGSLIKLNRSAGENIDLLVGGALVAFAEIVVFEEMLGVRITDFKSID